MPMQPFAQLFPHLAKDECRVLRLLGEREQIDDIPADGYALLEYYCNERKCNCRRVMLNVVRESTGRSVGMISFGLYPDSVPVGPFLDPLHPRAPFAHSVLEMVDDLVLSDAQYVARLRRHYQMFRAEITGRDGPTVLTADQVAQRIDERKRRHKALRRAQQRRR
ncbi:MAG TPA: hypothetical protein VNH11_19425 [Pirellulales bacterium]|nr:hypothetical protein [Pirellulales bacterium]